MRGCRLTLHALALLVAVSGAGCGVFHPYRPLTVEVRDAESGAPITGAKAEVSYLYMFDFSAPWSVSGETAGGRVRLWVAPYDVARLQITAADYLDAKRSFSAEDVKAMSFRGNEDSPLVV